MCKTHNCIDLNPSSVDSNILGEGDCDTDTDCAGTLVCGNDNCIDTNPDALIANDCCMSPTGTIFCLSINSYLRLY